MSDTPSTDARLMVWRAPWGSTEEQAEEQVVFADFARSLEQALREILARPMYHPRHGRPSDSKWITLNLRTSDVERYRSLL